MGLKKAFAVMDLLGVRAAEEFTPEGAGGMTWRVRDSEGDALVVGYVTHIPGMEDSPHVPGWRVDVLHGEGEIELELTTADFGEVERMISGPDGKGGAE